MPSLSCWQVYCSLLSWPDDRCDLQSFSPFECSGNVAKFPLFVQPVNCGLGREGVYLFPLNLCKFSTSSVLSLRLHAAFRNAKMGEGARSASADRGSRRVVIWLRRRTSLLFQYVRCGDPKAAHAESESHGAFEMLTSLKQWAIFMLEIIQSLLDFSMSKLQVRNQHK